MGSLWETDRVERPRSSPVRLVLLGALAPLAVIGALAGVMLAGPGASGSAAIGAEPQALDCASPRNAWRSSCRSATAAASPATPTVDESPAATGALPRKTGRASTKAPNVEIAAANLPSAASPAPSLAAAPDLATAAKPEAVAEALPAVEPVKTTTTRPEPARAADRPARLARYRVKPLAAGPSRVEQPRPAPAATKIATRSRPAARPREAAAAWTRLPPPASRDAVASPADHRVYADRAAPQATAAPTRQRTSGLKLMILPIPIAFRLQ
jgi:hypothetical protein